MVTEPYARDENRPRNLSAPLHLVTDPAAEIASALSPRLVRVAAIRERAVRALAEAMEPAPAADPVADMAQITPATFLAIWQQGADAAIAAMSPAGEPVVARPCLSVVPE